MPNQGESFIQEIEKMNIRSLINVLYDVLKLLMDIYAIMYETLEILYGFR